MKMQGRDNLGHRFAIGEHRRDGDRKRQPLNPKEATNNRPNILTTNPARSTSPNQSPQT